MFKRERRMLRRQALCKMKEAKELLERIGYPDEPSKMAGDKLRELLERIDADRQGDDDMDWRKSKEWLHDMIHYMPRNQIEYIIDELVGHGDVTRTEPPKPSILDEKWTVDGNTVYGEEGCCSREVICDASRGDVLIAIAAVPDALRMLTSLSKWRGGQIMVEAVVTEIKEVLKKAGVE